jgi:hypothetical protein
MKLDLPELERGIEKEAGVLGDLAQGAKGLMGGLTGGNMMDGLGSAMMGILPIAMAFGGGKKRAPIAPQFPGAAKPLFSAPGNVGSFNSMSKATEKRGGLVDLGTLKTILTARAANGIINTAQGRNNSSPEQSSLEKNPKHLELTSKYPEINKMLADPQSREYLESLLTKDTAYGS